MADKNKIQFDEIPGLVEIDPECCANCAHKKRDWYYEPYYYCDFHEAHLPSGTSDYTPTDYAEEELKRYLHKCDNHERQIEEAC